MSSTTVMAIVFHGVGCSGLGYLFWYAALQTARPPHAADPVLAVPARVESGAPA